MAMKKRKLGFGVGKRKTAVARARIITGKGRIRINKKDINTFDWAYQMIVKRPLMVLGKKAEKLDIEVNVRGGGHIAQAQAVSNAIARAAVAYFGGDEKLEERFWNYDPYLIKWDPRRVETKKFKGPKARARFQKSYR